MDRAGRLRRGCLGLIPAARASDRGYSGLSSAFWNFGMVFVSSLVIALFLASVLPSVVLSPLERVSQRIDLIRTGQFEAMPHDLPRERRGLRSLGLGGGSSVLFVAIHNRTRRFRSARVCPDSL